MENKGKIIGVGVVVILFLWCFFMPRVDNMTQLELTSITKNLIQTDIAHLSEDKYEEQRKNGTEAYDTAIREVQKLKKDTSGRGNKSAINYTKNMLELNKGIVADYATYKKIKNSKIHSIIVEYFWTVSNEIQDKPVSGVEFDSMLLWLYNHILL